MSINDQGKTYDNVRIELKSLIANVDICNSPFNKGLGPFQDQILQKQNQMFSWRGDEENSKLRNGK
jgi:hypothetical protein